MAFALYPHIERVVTGFIWLNSKQFDKDVFTRDQVTEMWADFLPRVQRYEIAYRENKWLAKPSGLCRNWCPVGRANCDFCGV